MPTPIDLTDKPLNLSPEFAYQVGPDSDAVYVAEPQNAHEMTNEKVLKEGDVVDSVNVVTAFSLGDAVLWQYSHEEGVPGEEDEKPKAKAKAKSTSSSKSSTKSSSSSSKSSSKSKSSKK